MKCIEVEKVTHKVFQCEYCGVKGSESTIRYCEREHECEQKGHPLTRYYFEPIEYIGGLDHIEFRNTCECGSEIDEDVTVDLYTVNEKLIKEVYHFIKQKMLDEMGQEDEMH